MMTESHDDKSRSQQPMMDDEPESESILAEMWAFMRVRKKLWLAPIILTLLLLGLLILFAGSAGVVSPFVYMM